LKQTHKALIGLIGLLFFVSTLNASPAFAKSKVGYDPYSPILKHAEATNPNRASARSRNRIMFRLLEQPLRPIGYALGKTAEWIERHHVDDKAIWLIDELAMHGIHPRLKFANETSFGTVGLGGKIKLLKLMNLEQPYVSIETSGGWAPNASFDGTSIDLGTSYTLKHPDMSVYHKGVVKYNRSSGESFYGLGSSPSLGEWSSYRPEELLFEASFGSTLSPSLDVEGVFFYQKMNIGNGSRNGIGRIKEHFGGTGIAGLDGGDVIGLRTEISYDIRDHESDPKEGGYGGLSVAYAHDTDDNEFQYMTFTGSAAHFFSLGSDRRVLAIRTAIEHHQEINGDDVPFYNLARLGGGGHKDGSDLLRSYRHNRFFGEASAVANAEYRYSVYDYGDFKGEAFLLFDVGGVFNGVQNFSFSALNLSYGAGVNIKFHRHTILSLVTAFGSEGIEAGAHSSVSF